MRKTKDVHSQFFAALKRRFPQDWPKQRRKRSKPREAKPGELTDK